MVMSTHKAIHHAAGKASAGWKGFVWYFKSLMGENAYQAYLDHHTRTHPGTRPMTEREFWRDKTDRQDRNPEGRCC
jgi:uncharacterized short protein YbdD (DUF466 family)